MDIPLLLLVQLAREIRIIISFGHEARSQHKNKSNYHQGYKTTSTVGATAAQLHCCSINFHFFHFSSFFTKNQIIFGQRSLCCVLQHRADIRDTKLFLFSQQNGSIYHFFCGGIFFSFSDHFGSFFSFQFHHLQHTRRVFKNLMRLPSVDIATGDATLYLFSPFHLLVKNDSDK